MNHTNLSYDLSGHFIEACDCTVICPCWVDDDPVGGHCTGLVAWTLDDCSMIDDRDVAGCTVVSVSTHGGSRRTSDSTTTVLYVDVPGVDGRDADKRFDLLTGAFSGTYAGPLEQLAQVSGTVAGRQRARISIEEDTHGANGPWKVTVRPLPAGTSDCGGTVEPDIVLVHADGRPKVFDQEKNNRDPLVLGHTALSHELGGDQSKELVHAQAGGRLVVNVGALPGGSLDVVNRSGMRGSFRYQSSPTTAMQAS